jgi:hypothetical protein
MKQLPRHVRPRYHASRMGRAFRLRYLVESVEQAFVSANIKNPVQTTLSFAWCTTALSLRNNHGHIIATASGMIKGLGRTRGLPLGNPPACPRFRIPEFRGAATVASCRSRRPHVEEGMPIASARRPSKPDVRLEFGKRGPEDAAELAEHLRRTGLTVELLEEPSADTHLLSVQGAMAEVWSVILLWKAGIAQGVVGNMVFETGKWAIRKTRQLLKDGETRGVRIRINPDEPDEVVFTASNTGAWRYEKLPTDEKKLLSPPRVRAPRKATKKKSSKRGKRRKT